MPGGRLLRLPDRRWNAVALLVLVVAPLFYLTRTPPEAINVDAEPVAMTAWHVVHEGSVDLRDLDTRGNYFIREYESGRVLSNRPVGLWLITIPAYLIGGQAYSPEPSMLLAVFIATAAVVVVLLLLWLVVEPPWALIGALIFALGTATWPISSSEIWPHGPGQLLLGLALLALATERTSLAGVAAAAALLVRPVTAVFPALFILAASARKRWRAALTVAAPVALALLFLIVYNGWAFGTPSISGGYGSDFSDRLVGGAITSFLNNLIDSLISPNNGILVWSPIVLVMLLGLRSSWRDISPWARDASIGGAAYFVLHARLNRASGGLPYDYRYALEPLTLAWPALVVSARNLSRRGERWRLLLIAATAASIIPQGLMAFGYECEPVPGADAICSIL